MAERLYVRSARGILTSITTIVMLCAVAGGKTIYVDARATGSNTGSSWAQAINSLQDALLLAYFSDEPVEIRVARGVYRPDQGLGIMPGDRSASFELMNGVTIKGGYAGSRGTNREVRNVKMLETILSGDLGAPDRPGDNSYHVVTGSGTDSTAVLDGCVITAGNGDSGGGMLNDNGSPTVINCTFRGNLAANGAGLYNINNSRPVLNNCTFSENVAQEDGGAMHNVASSPGLTGCTFSGNLAIRGGAVFNDADSSPSLTNCAFRLNSAEEGGGAMHNTESHPALAGCTFEENSTAGSGGAMQNYRSSPILLNCTFNANSATNRGGAVCNLSASEPSVANCLFSKNLAAIGGGMDNFDGGGVTLANCTFTGNSAEAEVGGALSSTGQAVLTNCILWADTPDEISGGGVTVSYSDIQGGVEGLSNINVDPLFADPDGDYHLRSQAGRWDAVTRRWVIDTVSSPCIDAGSPITTAEVVPSPSSIVAATGLIGDPSGTGFEPFPNGGRINMGAYGGTPEASLTPPELALRAAKASNPYPPNGAVGISPSVVLTWTAGLDAIAHDVYLGVDFEKVAQASPDNPAGVLASQGQSLTSYDPPGYLGSTQVYWWRIDEIDTQGHRIKGDVWMFTTGAAVKGRACFTAETPVWADGILVPISQVRPAQDRVAGISPARVEGILPSLAEVPGTLNTVEQLQEHVGAFACYDVILETGHCISVASCHYFMSESGRWIALQNLRVGTRLQTATGSVTVAAVYKRLKPYVGKVYNLKIKDADHYLVGKDALIARDY